MNITEVILTSFYIFLLLLLLLQNCKVYKWIDVCGIRFHAAGDRFDCVKLTHPLAHENHIYEYVRLLWILTGITSEPCCFAVPLFQSTRTETNAQSHGQKEVAHAFDVVTRKPSKFVFFVAAMLCRIEQIQFVPSRNCELGIVNHFYHSNIIASGKQHHN